MTLQTRAQEIWINWRVHAEQRATRWRYAVRLAKTRRIETFASLALFPVLLETLTASVLRAAFLKPPPLECGWPRTGYYMVNHARGAF